jgi:hypothetical protein
MPKKIIEDIITNKRSIRSVPISKTRKFYNSLSEDKNEYISDTPIKAKSERKSSSSLRVPNIQKEKEEATSNFEYREFTPPKPDNGLNSRIIIWGLAVFCFLVLVFTIFSSLSTATVKIYPKTTVISLNETFTASKDAPAGDLSFETIKLDKEMTKIVAATAEENVSTKASGDIIIYNNYSANSQRLVKNTRFTNKTGNVYRLTDSTVVPGRKKVNGVIIPGSVTATVVADAPGKEYNSKVSDLNGDFKIPGFLGMPSYDGFYARLKTDLVGGYVGLLKKVSTDVQAAAEDELQQNLKTEILSEVFASKPETHIIFDGGYFWDFGQVSSSTSADGTGVEFKQTGTLHVILFNADKLARYLAKAKISADFSDPVTINQGNEVMKINIDTSKLAGNVWEANVLPIQFTGDVKLVWQFDIDKVRQLLVGVNLKDVDEKISSVVKAEKAEVSIRPAFWSGTLPSKAESIIIENIIK